MKESERIEREFLRCESHGRRVEKYLNDDDEMVSR